MPPPSSTASRAPCSGAEHIFLSTDCADTAAQCRALTEMRCTTLPLERGLYDVGASRAPEHNPHESAYDQWIERRIQLGQVDGSLAALHAIAEIDTLASCHYFVGRLDSVSKVCVCVCACVRARARARVCMCVCVYFLGRLDSVCLSLTPTRTSYACPRKYARAHARPPTHTNTQTDGGGCGGASCVIANRDILGGARGRCVGLGGGQAISRLALMLMTARRGPRPFVSLDKPWAQPPSALIN
jgi:hypothetical protein